MAEFIRRMPPARQGRMPPPGGYAIATGIYKGQGLDVTIKIGDALSWQWDSIVDGGAVDLLIDFGIDGIKAAELPFF